MEKRGLVIGKFAPLHIGHMYFLTKCLEKCDELYIILSYDQRFVDKQPKEIQLFLRKEDRLDDLHAFIVDYLSQFNKPIYVGVVDESNIPENPNGWPEFIDLVKKELKDYGPNIIFSSEPSYNDDYKKYLPECEHIIIEADRKTFNVSATEIRRQLYELYKYSRAIDDQVSIEFFKDRYERIKNSQ